MSSNQQESSSSNGQPNPALSQLLALATEAQGERPRDPSVQQMRPEDRAWLENALDQLASDSDPVKKLKRWMQRLQEIEEATPDNLADLNDILEEIGDLVCDLDLAQVFCSLGGLGIVQKFLAKQFDPANALFVHLLAVLAQYNQKVQQLMIKDTFLEHCLATIVDETKSVDYRHKSVSAISAIVKAYLPALIRFVQLDGPDKLMACFDHGLQVDEQKLVHRCAVASVALKNSFSPEVVNIDPNFRKVSQWPEEMRKKIEQRNEEANEQKYMETLEFLK